MRKNFSLLFIIALMSVVISFPVMANTGRIVTMSGQVTVNGAPVKKSYQIKSGDEINTGANSKINIVMADKSVLDLQPNTRFKLEKFQFNAQKPAKSRSIMNLLNGSFRYISGLVGRTRSENATIKMGKATAEIQGSLVTFEFDGQSVRISTILGVGILKLGGRTVALSSGTTRTGNVTTGQSSSGPIAGNEAKLATALEGIKADPAAIPVGLSSDDQVLLVVAVVADREALGIPPSAVGTATTNLLAQADSSVKPAIAGAATLVAEGDIQPTVSNAISSAGLAVDAPSPVVDVVDPRGGRQTATDDPEYNSKDST